MAQCPVCKKDSSASRKENPSAPFCSTRCRDVDLGRWLGEQYRIPAVENDGVADAINTTREPGDRVN